MEAGKFFAYLLLTSSIHQISIMPKLTEIPPLPLSTASVALEKKSATGIPAQPLITSPGEGTTIDLTDQREMAIRGRQKFLTRQNKTAAMPSELTSNFRAEYEYLYDYMEYVSIQRKEFPDSIKNDEYIPDLELPREEYRPSIGIHPETILDPHGPFSVVGLRAKGAPLMVFTEEIDWPLLTSSLAICCSVWICATNNSETKGIHALFHINPLNFDPMKYIKAVTEIFKQRGYPILKLAQVTGANIDPKKFSTIQSEEGLERTAFAAQLLVNGVTDLGYGKVIDHTRENRPFFITKEVNVGGLMRRSKISNKIEFIPIGKGIFRLPHTNPQIPPDLQIPR